MSKGWETTLEIWARSLRSLFINWQRWREMGAGHPEAKALRGSASTRGTGAGTGVGRGQRGGSRSQRLAEPCPLPCLFPPFGFFPLSSEVQQQQLQHGPSWIITSQNSEVQFLGAFLRRHPRPCSTPCPLLCWMLSRIWSTGDRSLSHTTWPRCWPLVPSLGHQLKWGWEARMGHKRQYLCPQDK